MRTSFKSPGGTLIVSAVAGQVIFTITDGQTSRSIAAPPHVADAIASETLRTATFAARQGDMQQAANVAAAAKQAHSNVIGFPVGAS